MWPPRYFAERYFPRRYFASLGAPSAAETDLWGRADRVLALVAAPFDPTIEQTFPGPPVPFGLQAFGNELEGWIATGAERQVYFSDAGYTSRPADSPANTYFPPLLSTPFNYQVRLFQGGNAGGRSRPGQGDIRLINADGALDALLPLGWDGRTLLLYEGRRGAAFSTFVLRAVLTCDGLSWTESEISIRLRDGQGVFARAIEADFYSGDGGLDGDAALAGLARPQAYGACFNVEPVQVSAALLIYQVNDRQTEAVVAVRDSGQAHALDTALGPNGDFATYDELAAATIGAAKYATCLALGLIRLGSAPDGRITADVKGDAFGGYVATPGGIVRRIATTRMGRDSLSDPSDLDSAAFDQLEADQPAAIGYYVGTARRQVDEIFDEIMASVGGFWDVTLMGKLRPFVLKAPAGAAVDTLTRADIAENAQLQRTGIRARKRQRVGYEPMWIVQSADDLAAGVSPADKERFGREFRWAPTADPGVGALHKFADEVDIRGLFAERADAEAEVGRLQALHGVERSLYAVQVKRSEFLRSLGDVIEIAGLDRFGFADPQPFRLVAIQADAGGPQRAARTVWELWG